MKFGIGVPNYGEALSLDGLTSVATEAEKLGYESLWTTDHILMSRGSGTPYEKIFDSIATLAYLAPLTKKVNLGISSLIIGMRNPVAAAKQLASIDAFAGGGRVLLAMASGWNEKEFGNVGADYHRRGKMLNDSILLFRNLWKGEGKFYGGALKATFDDGVFEPAPVDRAIVIWIGGVSPAAMKRAAELGDAWHPNVIPLASFRELVGQFRKISPSAEKREICVRIGLNTQAKESEYVGATGEKRIIVSGNMIENENIISELEKLGVSKAVLVTSPDGKIPAETQLQSMRDFADKFL